MLIFNPKKRISVEEALQHPFLKELYCPEDEPTRTPLNPLEFEFEHVNLNKEQIKDMIYEEILIYHFPDFKKEFEKKLSSGEGIVNHIKNNANKEFSNYEKEDSDDN